MGLNYSLTGVFYNKTLAAQIGMTSAADDGRRVRGAAGKAKAAGLDADHASATAARPAACVPAAAADGDYGPTAPINDWIFQKPGATIDTADQPDGRHAPRAVDQGRLLQHGRERDRVPDDDGKFGTGEGLFMFNGDWEAGNLDKRCRATSGSS